MSIETRILAVCDVYDALVSDRVYRAAWTPERAFALLEEESAAYDQTVVAALKRVTCGPVSGPRGSPISAPAPPSRHAPRRPRRTALRLEVPLSTDLSPVAVGAT